MRKLRKIRLHQEGTRQLTVGFFVWLITNAVVYYLTYPELRWLFILFAVSSTTIYLLLVNFFRCPPRRFPGEDTDGIVVAPADGKVVVIEEIDAPKGMECERCIQMSVYMTFYNVHVNWHPVSGEVVYKDHFDGDYLLAWHPKSSSLNEHTTVAVRTLSGVVVAWRQISGWIARRIVCYPKVGDRVAQNTKLGCIKFGSRVDVFLPLGSQILVKLGDKVVGSQTPLARLSNPTE